MSRAQFIAFCLVLLVALGSPRYATASDLVVVWLMDGRMLAGEIDPRTNDERLWLRSVSPTFVIATSAAWNHIKAINANGERLTVEAFAERVDQFRPMQADANALPLPAREADANATTPVTRPFVPPSAATRVTSLDVEACVANWDQDAATDGIELRVLPRNTFGQLVPGSGQITARLTASNRLALQGPDAFPQLGRWSLQADTNDFGPAGAIYRLPFRGPHPDEEDLLEPYGLIEVSFYVAGEGRFTSDATVLLRKFNPIRRDMQLRTVERDR